MQNMKSQTSCVAILFESPLVLILVNCTLSVSITLSYGSLLGFLREYNPFSERSVPLSTPEAVALVDRSKRSTELPACFTR